MDPTSKFARNHKFHQVGSLSRVETYWTPMVAAGGDRQTNRHMDGNIV